MRVALWTKTALVKKIRLETEVMHQKDVSLKEETKLKIPQTQLGKFIDGSNSGTSSVRVWRNVLL